MAGPNPARETAPSKSPPPSPAHHGMGAWPVAPLAAAEGEVVVLAKNDGIAAVLRTSVLRAFAQAARRINAAVPATQESGRPVPELRIIEGRAANAFAVASPSSPVIAANFGMLSLLGEDEALWAAVYGHELAHLLLGHQQQRQERSEMGEAVRGVLSVVLSFAGIPLAPLLTDGATTMVTLGYSRDDEREADAMAVRYLRQADYDPAAALHFHERLAQRSGESGGLLSTHPGGSERVEAIRRQLECEGNR